MKNLHVHYTMLPIINCVLSVFFIHSLNAMEETKNSFYDQDDLFYL